MFIEEVVAKIWEPVSEEYTRHYAAAAKIEPVELFEHICGEIHKLDNVVYKSRELNMTMLATSGCPHNIRKGKFSGCSMCDYNSYHVENLAKMSALKHADQALYARAIRFSFDDKRGKASRPAIVELISGHDCLNPEEMSDEVFEEVFGKEELFSRKPYKTIFETRVSSITRSRLLKWKEKLGRRIAVEFGIEVYDEWVRQHWINKNTSQKQMESAFKIIKETECESSANILIGIPGFTEDDSIRLFKESFHGLVDLGATYVLCSPLSRKPRTLQGFIYERLRGNTALAGKGLVCGELTGMPSIFTVYEAICQVAEERPDALSCLVFSPSNFPLYFEEIQGIGKTDPDGGRCTAFVIDALNEFNLNKDITSLAQVRKRLQQEPVYMNYLKWKEKQAENGNMKQVIHSLGEEIAKELWPMEWESKLSVLQSELQKGSGSVGVDKEIYS